MLCEQCGNEFYKNKYYNKDGKSYVRCPFCGFENEKTYSKKNKKNKKNFSRGEDR